MTQRIPFENAITTMFGASIVVVILLISCRYHPEIFRIFYNIVVSVYGLKLAKLNEEGVHTAWGGAQAYPIFVLLVTGSLWHFLFQGILQLIYLNFLYKPALLSTVIYMTPTNFTNSMTSSWTVLGILNLVIVSFLQIFLQNAYKKAYVAEKTKDEAERQKVFLLGFSHELRNLINSLMGNVHLAGLEQLSSQAKDFLKNANLCGELLLHLVNNILDTGKVEVGDLEINPMNTDIFNTMERIWSVCSELIRRKNIKGIIKIQKNLPKILKIDHYRLTQIFLNLIGNAVKFTEQGVIDVTIQWISGIEKVSSECFEPYPFNDDDFSEGIFEKDQCFSSLKNNFFTLTTSQKRFNKTLLVLNNVAEKGLLKIIVKDTGCGMDNEDQSKLFQKFTQVSSDASKRKLGTGLGLFITKELCRKMNGEIKVFSKKNIGSYFILCLPISSVLDEHNVSIPKTASVGTLTTIPKYKALIVDDEYFSHSVLSNFFKRLDMEVLDVAEDGLVAYRKYIDFAMQENRPQIVTMDLNMPVMDGKKAAEKIREFEKKRGIEPCFLIVISGNCSESEIEECMDKNGNIQADAFIKKPASLNELSQVITRYFSRGSHHVPLVAF